MDRHFKSPWFRRTSEVFAIDDVSSVQMGSVEAILENFSRLAGETPGSPKTFELLRFEMFTVMAKDAMIGQCASYPASIACLVENCSGSKGRTISSI